MKLGTTRTITSFQPDARNGHKPSVTVQFWGDKSIALRGSTQGPGRPPKSDVTPEKRQWWEEPIKIDDVTLKPVKQEAKKKNWTPKQEKPKKTLDDLVAQYNQRRIR